MKKINIVRTKKGLPALWESGGGYTNTGNATIITNPDGSKKKPVYIRRRGHLACGNHALFIVSVGDLVIKTNHHRDDYETTVFRIVEIEDDQAILEPIYVFDTGEWDKEPTGLIKDAVDAAKTKASHYHCREPYYYLKEDE